MIYAISIICVFSIIIFVHELGHYLAARSVGIRVEKFYIGFNLFGLGLSKKIGDTEYGIGAFPLGGYVKVSGIVDESMDMETTGAEHEYLSKTSLQQLWFSSAGVIMNFILSLILFILHFLPKIVSTYKFVFANSIPGLSKSLPTIFLGFSFAISIQKAPFPHPNSRIVLPSRFGL